jgi:ribosome-associated toxin RatA of RatAB toxin-antitoxin module
MEWREDMAVLLLLLGVCSAGLCEAAHHQPLSCCRHGGVLQERLRGGWSHPLMPDVFAHPLPDLDPPPADSSTRRVMVRSSSRATLHGWYSGLVPARRARRDVPEAKGTTAAHGSSVSRTIFVDASVEECFAAATVFEDYPKWAGGIQGLRVLEREQSGIGALVEWDMGLFGITTKNKMRYQYEKPRAGRALMKWHVTEGGIKELVGRYEFVAVGPEQTKVVYNLFVEPGFPLPDMIKRATQRTIANAALQELKKHTERVRKSRLEEEAQAAEARGRRGREGTSRTCTGGAASSEHDNLRDAGSQYADECVFSSPLFSH